MLNREAQKQQKVDNTQTFCRWKQTSVKSQQEEEKHETANTCKPHDGGVESHNVSESYKTIKSSVDKTLTSVQGGETVEM